MTGPALRIGNFYMCDIKNGRLNAGQVIVLFSYTVMTNINITNSHDKKVMFADHISSVSS